jgi:SAM-dependent methyltransferase
MLRDHLRGKAGGAILEVDGGSSEPALAATVFFSSYEQWAEAEREALKEVRGRILDIGCGAGRHALYFQERGHEVVAVDISWVRPRLHGRAGSGTYACSQQRRSMKRSVRSTPCS